MHIRPTYPDQLIFGTCSQKLTIRTKAHASDVEIAIFIHTVILKERYLLTSRNIKDLCRAIATGCNISTVEAESDAADDTFVHQVVHHVDVENTGHIGIKDRKPLMAFALQMIRSSVRVYVCQLITIATVERGLEVWSAC